MRRYSEKKRIARISALILCLLLIGGCGMSAAPGTPVFEEIGEDGEPEKKPEDEKETKPESETKGEAKDKAESDSGEEPELVEPVGTIERFVPAEFREISHVTTLQGMVCPDTIEYAYESSRAFGNYGALPGETVSAGDTLFYGAEDSADDEIEAIEEENATLLEEFTVYSADTAAEITKAKKEEFEAADAFQGMYNNAPEEDSPWYSNWAKAAMPLEKRAKQTRAAREKLEQALKERQEQFDLEYAYNEQRIARLQAEKEVAAVTSAAAGVVVAATYHLPGDKIEEGAHILAVGDTDSKEILCEYVSKAIVTKAADVYAIIDGKRFEVQYEVMEPEEYRRIKKRDGDVYTTFHLVDPSNEIVLGQYAVIIVVEDRTPNVLCVPKDAVNKDDRGSYVFVYENGESVYTPVTTGIFDSTYIEITSGLKEGDPVVYDPPYIVGSKTIKLEKGNVTSPFKTDGYLYYPSAEWLVNPAKTGTCYLKELLAHRYELVEEGQVLAKIEIVSDEIEIARIRRKIDRQNARLADLNKKRSETYNEEEIATIDRSIRDRNRTIESLNRQLEKLSRYTGVYEIKAPVSGIITDISERKTGELIDYRERIVQISRDDSCFIVVEDKEGRVSYGDTAKVSVRTFNAKERVLEGKVVTVSPWGLSKEMRTGTALIKVPQEDVNAIPDMEGANSENGYWTRSSFGVEVMGRSMNDVLLVPKKAVYNAGSGGTFVMTKNKDGSVKLIKFEAGGSDNSYYWVAYGDLTEGMEICSE